MCGLILPSVSWTHVECGHSLVFQRATEAGGDVAQAQPVFISHPGVHWYPLCLHSVLKIASVGEGLVLSGLQRKGGEGGRGWPGTRWQELDDVGAGRWIHICRVLAPPGVGGAGEGVMEKVFLLFTLVRYLTSQYLGFSVCERGITIVPTSRDQLQVSECIWST